MIKEQNDLENIDNEIKISKFKRFLHVVFGDIFFKFLAIFSALIVWLTFKMVI